MADDTVQAGPPSSGSPVLAVLDHPTVRAVTKTLAAVVAFYFVQQRLWPAPAGVLLQGVVLGGLTALISFGIALIYRSNRIINFSAGELGAVPASLAVLLIVGPGLPYLLAVPLGLGAALALGAVIEFLIIRRFFTAPRLILTVVTIGVSSLLAGVGFLLPRAFDINTPPQSFPSPFDFSFAVGQTRFSGNDVVAMIAVPLCIVLLGAFYRYTNIGIAVRASAESADRAALLGVPVKRIQTIVWVIATVLSFVAVFLRAGIVGLPFGQLLGPSILVKALAATVIGRMEKMPAILVASLGLGILESAIIFETGEAVLVDPIMFVIITGALLFQRSRKVARGDETSNWQTATDFRPIPRELLALREVRWTVRGVLGTVVAGTLALPLVMNEADISLATVIVVTATVAVSLVVLTGWAGQVSLGQIGFLGIGAAVGAWLTQTWTWDISLAILAAGLVGAGTAMVIGLPALRIKGLLLSVSTLSFALAASSYALNRSFFDWLPTARFERPLLFGRIAIDTETRYFYFALAGLVIAIYLVKGLRRSRTGRVLIAVRENERAAQSYGVSATRAKLLGFALSGFIAAYAGAIFVHHQQVFGIQPYSVGQSLTVFIMAVFGGLGSISGAIAGVVLLEGIQYFRDVFPEAIADSLQFLASGVGLIVVLAMLPGGLSQALYTVRDRWLRKVADRHDLHVPSLVADSRVAPSEVEASSEEPEPADVAPLVMVEGAGAVEAPAAVGSEQALVGLEADDDRTWAPPPDAQPTEEPEPVGARPTRVRRARQLRAGEDA
jgi:branched-chain amino acid transport system permease protein